MTSKKLGAIFATILLSSAAFNLRAFAAPGEKWYGEWWGSDAELWVNFSKECGRDLGFKSKCYKFSRINSFAIEADGILYCDAEKAPAMHKPLTPSSKCTSRGWQTVK